MSDGGITVSKVSTGTFFIEDIRILVAHHEATYIPASKALASTDLHRALGTKILFQLMNSLPVQAKKPIEEAPERIVSLELENKRLRDALERSTKQGTALQESMSGLEKQMASLVGVVEKLATAPPQVVQVVNQAGVPVVAAPVNEAVGGAVPMFIPDDLVPKEGVDVRVKVQEGVSEGGSVNDAANRLRQLRKGNAG